MGLYPKNLKEFVALCGVPRAHDSKVFIVDTEHGSDSNIGTSFDRPLLTLEAAYALCTADRHDTVLFVARDTADNPSAAITWGKDYTHLIGVGCDLPGLGQRCRVVTQAATAASPVITFSKTGCIVKNMQFNNEKAAGAASGVAVVTGSRNYFENVFFMAPTASDAASYSLKMSGSENVFKDCTIGQFTNFRSEASYGLWLTGTGVCLRNTFRDCRFLSWGGGAGGDHVAVWVDTTVDVLPWSIEFDRCLFHNNYYGGTILAQAINDDSTAAGHQIILRNGCEVYGFTAVGSTLTYTFNAEMTGTKSGVLGAVLNES
jgi:hypothetical protein